MEYPHQKHSYREQKLHTENSIQNIKLFSFYQWDIGSCNDAKVSEVAQLGN